MKYLFFLSWIVTKNILSDETLAKLNLLLLNWGMG